jgi:predicted metal-binding membrane protein
MAETPLPPAGWTAGYWIIMLLMWWVMMIAMMTPSAAPMILLYARATRYAQGKGQLGRGVVPAAAFAGGYLLAWFGFSLFATLLQRGLEASGGISAMWMASRSAGLSAAVLILAGAYQLSPWKHMCLNHCRAPAEFLSRRRRPGRLGALRMGVEHGAFCVGCCWVLMALLFVGGIMNVLWIAVLTIVVLLEKLTPRGPWFARIAGIVLVAWGAATLVV